jgi:hypothetical protein
VLAFGEWWSLLIKRLLSLQNICTEFNWFLTKPSIIIYAEICWKWGEINVDFLLAGVGWAGSICLYVFFLIFHVLKNYFLSATVRDWLNTNAGVNLLKLFQSNFNPYYFNAIYFYSKEKLWLHKYNGLAYKTGHVNLRQKSIMRFTPGLKFNFINWHQTTNLSYKNLRQ